MTLTKPVSFQAIDRACLVLETLARQGSMNLNTLHMELKLNKASLLRIMLSLIENGFVIKDEKTGEYKLSLKLFELGVKASQNTNYPQLINSELEKLSKNLNVTAQFSVEENNELLCLQSVDPNKSSGFSIYTNIGSRSPLYATSAGKAILSTYSNDEVLEKWKNFRVKKFTSHTITDFDSLLKDLSLTRQRQYAIDAEETQPGLFCIGAVLKNYTNRPIGAISLSSSKLTREDEKRYSLELLKSTHLLSASMGYTGI